VNESIVIRVPASSANLGAGFDVLGMALDLFLDVGFGDPPADARSIDRHHPTAKAFSAMNGVGGPSASLWVRTSIPMSRGLGFSGAARVGGAALAVAAAGADPGGALAAERDSIIDVVARLERHGDNAAASVLGGVAAWADGRAIPLRVGPRVAAAAVVVWIPDVTTSTDQSRDTLPELVARADAVLNLGRIAQFVAAIEHDDPALLVGATEDRLHQPLRLVDVPGAAAALAVGVAAGAWCGWLSGSGPTVALLVADDLVEVVTTSLPRSGHVKRLRIAARGAHLLDRSALR
jgi:homoserine kinase